MHNHWKKISILFAVVILGGLIAFLPTLVLASHQPASPLPNPVAPEPYPNSDIYPAVVYLADQADLQILYRLDIDLEGLKPADGVRDPSGSPFEPSIATIYINPTQSAALLEAGLTPIPIPNEGYRSFLAYGPGNGSPNAWPSYAQYVTRMQALVAAHPGIVRLESIGKSVQNRDLWCLEISDNLGADEFEPEFKYTANHHGDETTGVEMVMRLAELLANSYGVDPNLTDMVDKMEIWLCPIYNPDGYTSGSRYNAHGADLNRDFPDRITDPVDNPAGREPETQAFMQFGYAHRFSMGANYHGGAQVFNYPWDSVSGSELAPDDQLFWDFGYGYTSRNSYLWGGGFPYGMTRGWEWYIIRGGMQDWAYYWHGEHHVTIEISNTKKPPFEQMDPYWEENRDAMIWWMQRAFTGLGGSVLDARDSTPLIATVTLAGWSQPPLNTILTDPQAGDYHRVIGAGNYTLQASAACYQSQSVDVSVVSGTLTTQDFFLDVLPDFTSSTKNSSVEQALPSETVEYQIRVENSCPSASVAVTDTLPAQVSWTGYLTATQGIPSFDSGQILWEGDVEPTQPVTITYSVKLNECLAAGMSILNTAVFDDQVNELITRTAPVTVKNDPPGLPSSPAPADGAVEQPLDTTLAWTPSSDLNCDPLTYDVALGTSPDPEVVAVGLTLPNFVPQELLPGTTYYWYVIAHDGLTQTMGPTWSFTTMLSTIQPNRTFLPVAIK